jgi:hypothetical protein
MRELTALILSIFAVALMFSLIPFVRNDYTLSIAYLAIIGAVFGYRHDKKDITVFFYGLVLMTVSESFFIATGVETFVRNSFFGLMPLWLPLLWGYGFVVIKRIIAVLP